MPVSLSTILKQNSAQGTRYTVTRPLTALVAICLPSAVGAFAVGAPIWVGTSFAIAGLLALLVHLSTYIYCVINDRDAVRKETFTLQQPTVEKSLIAPHDIATLSAAKTNLIDNQIMESSASEAKLLERTE
jgi:hypothetical protein